MAVGIMVLPPYNKQSTPLIKKSIGTQAIVSNVSSSVYGARSNRHTRLSIDEYSSVTDTSIIIAKDELDHPMHNEYANAIAHMIEIAKRSEKLLIVAPGPKIPLLPILIASKIRPLTDIRAIVGGRLLTSAEVIAELANADKRLLGKQWDELRKQPAKIRPEDCFKTPNGATLRPYQQQMVNFAVEKKRAGLFVDMGLGKTLATLATLDHLVKEDKIDPKRPVLIVAPIMVALDTWSREAEKWGYDMDVKINIQLSVKKREALLETLLVPQEKLTLFTTNPAQLKPILQFFARKGVSSPFDVVIVDELSQFKSPDAQRFEHLTQISELSEYFFGLTGTPSPNNLIDIWSQMIAIDSKNRRLLGDNFYVYRGNFFEPTQTGMRGGREVVFDWGLKRGADQAIYDRMKESAISMRSEGLIDLPKIVFDNKYVKLPKKAMKTYQKMDKVLRQQLREQEADGEEQGAVLSVDGRNIEIANSAVLTSKLLQLSGGALYDNVADASANETNYTVFHNEKMKAVKELVENSTSPILIFYFFKSELERLREFIEFEHLSSKMKQDDIRDTIKRWNDGKIPVIVAHPGSVGHGLNLQDGGHTMVWLTTTWSNEQYRQAVKRLYRSGQKETVTVIHLLAEGTEDENVIKRIDLKETGQDELMRALDIAQRE